MAQNGCSILVTNVSSDGPRLKIWGITDQQNLSYIEKNIDVLSKNFNHHQGIPNAQTSIPPNTLCCVKYRGSYVRAKVHSIVPNGVLVHLIDSGAIEILPMDFIRLLTTNTNEEILLLTATPLAHEFILANIVAINENWESRSIETILSYIKDKELEITKLERYNNRNLVKLSHKGQDIGNVLVNRMMAVMTTFDKMFKSQMYSQQAPYSGPADSHQHQVPAKEITSNGYSSAEHIYNSPHAAQMTNMPVENWRYNQQLAYAYQQNLAQQSLAQHNLPRQNVMHRDVTPQFQKEEAEPSVLEFRGRLLEVGQTYPAYVSCVEDGPNKFSVQLMCMKKILKDLMSEIQKESLSPLREPPLPGSVCLARLKNVGNIQGEICRAVVMATMETHIKIYYVDFGHTDTVPYSDIYQLPPKFINPKVLSIRFCLTGLKEMNITEEAKKYFKDFIHGKEVLLRVCEPEGPFLIQYGDIFCNNKNIKEYLKERFPDIAKVEYGHLPALTDGTKEIVQVSFIVSCSNFFVQLEKNLQDIEEMMDLISNYAVDAPPLSKLSVGSICIAPYNVDNMWYRVKILNVLGEKVTVLYVDYGNEELVSRNQLRLIRKDLVTKMPSQAILCVLNGFQNRCSNKELNTMFENLVLEKRLSILVRNAQPTSLVVDVLDITVTPAKSINAQLINMLAESTDSSNDTNVKRKSNESNKSQGQTYQRSDGKEQSTVTQPKNQKSKSKAAKARDEMEAVKTPAGSGSNPFRSANSDERYNSKSWKDDHNEQRHDNRYQRRDDSDRLPRDGGNNSFNRGGNNPFNREGGNNSFERDGGYNRDAGNDRFNRNGGNDRFNREGIDRFNRDAGSNRFGREGNDRNNFREGGRFNNRDDRSGGGRFGLNKRDQGYTPEKTAASDNESIASSRGSGKRGERGRRDSNPKPNFNKYGNNENDSFRPRRNDDNSENNFRTRSARDDGFGKSKETINFNTQSDFSEPKKLTLNQPIITIGSTNGCELVYLTNPSNFFIHLTPQNLKLDQLMEGIASTYEIGGKILESSQVKPDMVCIAQFAEDDLWYRAIIKSVEGTNAIVLFVDYGNMEKVSFEKLKEIKEEFIDLPIQAVSCKLFGAKKTDWSAEEIDSFGEATNEKQLQAEFVAKDKDVYQVILRQMENEVVKPDIINQPFCPGVDFMQAKEDLKNKGRISSGIQKIQSEYAPLESKWSEQKVSPGKKEAVLITWFDNPESFYCQSIVTQREFRPMMDEIQKVYAKRPSVHSQLQPGYAVIAVFAEDRVFYRAEIVQVNDNQSHIVQYIDFGNKATVHQRNIYPVETKYMSLPKQAILCSLKNVIPANGEIWSNINSNEVYKYFDADELECTYHEEKDEKCLVSLSNNGVDIAGILVEKKLALFSVAGSDSTVHDTATAGFADNTSTPRFDIKLLPSQTLRVKVSNVESISKFHVQFSSAEDCNEAIASYMASKDPEVMPRLSSHEVCLGAGCLVYTEGFWRRAVVVNCSETTSFDVRLIDTGAYEKTSLDCMLALPSQLSVMQNQAIECSLLNLQPSSSLNEKFKNLVEKKDVIIYVDEVDNNRLIVEVYDLSGRKIKLTDDDIKTTSPICSMPILSSTHSVTVSGIVDSNNLWLQRLSDVEKHEKLNLKMHEFYSKEERDVIVDYVPGSLCVVKTLDERFCRASIIKKTENQVFVNLIDEGLNVEVSLDTLKVMDPQFYVPHQLAIQVSLIVSLSGSPSEQTEVLQPHLLAKEFVATFYNVHKKWIVELVENGVKLSETLTSRSHLVKKTTATISEEIPGMTLGGKYKADVTHCDSPAQFWLQRSDENPLVLELQEELQNAVSSYPEVDTILDTGTLCAAIFDGFWYRAEVIDACDEITTVRFIDYGNTDVITNKTGKIKELPDSIKMKKTYAMKCRLDVIPVDSEDWSDETCMRFSNLVINIDNLEAALIAESVPKRVDLFVNGKSISDILVEEGRACKVHHEEELVEEIIENELDPRSAFISHIYSPNEFYVQEEKSVPDLEKIQDRFLVADMLPILEDVAEGILCVAKYTDNDWYRARVISQDEAGIKLLFIDYGNFAFSTEIRVIPDDVASIPPLSRKCSLQLPKYASNWPENALDNFCKFAADGATIFLMDVIEEGETTIVKLTHEDKDVAELLVGPPKSVFISHINSTSDFYVQEVESVSEIEKNQEELLEADNYPTVQIEEGLICAAKFHDDDQWYRAKVLSHNENETAVQFIDYGNTSVSTEIRALPEHLLNLAPFAKKCSLNLPSYAKEWPQDAFDNFCTLAGDGLVPFFLDIVKENETMVVNLIFNEENIAEKLVPEVVKKQVQEVDTSGENITITCTSSENETKTTSECISEDPVKETKEDTPEKEDAIIPQPDLPPSVPEKKADSIPVYISQLTTPNEFWIQEEQISDDIHTMEIALIQADAFSQISEAKEGFLCAAKFPDDSLWYRAKVLSKDENGTFVSFIDYGNSSTVTEIRNLPANLAVMPSLAKKCSLKLPLNLKGWPEEASCEFVRLSADGTNCFLMDVLEDGETAIVNLSLDGESVADKLVAYISQKVSTEEVTVPEKKTDSPVEESLVPEESAIQEKASLETEADTPTTETINKKPDPVSVYIVQLNSPKDFWVQEEKNFDEVQKMEDALIKADVFSQLSEVQEGLLCAANFPDDSLWYRAKVLSQDENGTFVSFIDYGNSSTVTEMRNLPADLAAMPSLAKKCSLKLPLNLKGWPEEALSEFVRLSADGTNCFLMEVLEDGETAIVNLSLDGENVADKLVAYISQKVSTEEVTVPEKKTDSPIEESLVPEESAVQGKATLETEADTPTTETINTKPDPVPVYIVQLNSPKDFWVQEEKNFDEVQKMEDALLEADGFSQLSTVKEGLLCAAKFPDDSLWYRAKVLSQDENGTFVSFIDYGNSSTVTEMRNLPADLAVMPSLAKKCSLMLPLNLTGWPEEALSEFVRLSADGTNCFLMDVLEDGETAIVNLSLDGESVADKLVAYISQKVSTEEVTVSEKKTNSPVKESLVPEESAIQEKASLETEADTPTTETINTKPDPVFVYISQPNSPEEFCVQEKEYASKIVEMEKNLLNIKEFQHVEQVTEGLIYAAQFPDDPLWYRAKVISCNENDKRVCFIDYGHSSSVKELRLLSEELKAMPPLVKKCSLKLPLDVSEWPKEACTKFIKLCAEGSTLFEMDILNDGEPLIVDLKLEGENIADKLISSVRQKLAEEETAVVEHEENKSESEVVTDANVDGEAEKADSSSFLVRNVISPSEFWGQLEKDRKNIQAKLLDAEEWPPLSKLRMLSTSANVKEDILCAAKVKEEWHRARVQSIDNGHIQVLLIDEGYTPICSEFRQLPPDLAEIPPLSRKYSLKLPESVDEWSQAATAAFSKYSETSFSMEVLEEAEIPVIKLLHHGEDVAQILASMHDDFSKEIVGRLPPEGEENWNIFISHVNSPSEFWGQSQFVIPELDAMEQYLKDASSLTPVKNFDVGRICAAKFPEDGAWYRGKILSHSVEGTQVFYVDFGSTTLTNELRVLPHNVVNIEYLATKYSLRKPADIDEWSKEACAKFVELVADGLTMFQYEILDFDNKEVQLIHKGMDVVDILAPLCKKTTEDTKTGIKAFDELNCKPTKVEVVDLTESDPESPSKEIYEKKNVTLELPDSAFCSAEDKNSDSSQLSHDAEPVASSSMRKDDYNSSESPLPESNVDPSLTPKKEQAKSDQSNERRLDDIMEKNTYQLEDNIISSNRDHPGSKILSIEKLSPINIASYKAIQPEEKIVSEDVSFETSESPTMANEEPPVAEEAT